MHLSVVATYNLAKILLHQIFIFELQVASLYPNKKVTTENINYVHDDWYGLDDNEDENDWFGPDYDEDDENPRLYDDGDDWQDDRDVDWGYEDYDDYVDNDYDDYGL